MINPTHCMRRFGLQMRRTVKAKKRKQKKTAAEYNSHDVGQLVPNTVVGSRPSPLGTASLTAAVPSLFLTPLVEHTPT